MGEAKGLLLAKRFSGWGGGGGRLLHSEEDSGKAFVGKRLLSHVSTAGLTRRVL